MLSFEKSESFQTQNKFHAGTWLILSRIPMLHDSLYRFEASFYFLNIKKVTFQKKIKSWQF